MLAVALAALDRTLADHPVDQDRVYLTGLSMGGFGAWYLAARHPDRFAAVAPVCGGGPEEQAARLKDIPIWAWHGADDRAVPPARSRNMIQKIRDAGGTPRHTELEGVGHASWTAAYALDGVLPWMWEQRRASKTPSWATVLEERPSRTVVKDAEGRRRMEATGLPWRVKDKDGIEYLLIPPGRYLRGGLEDETRGVTGGEEELEKDFAGERPQHQVRLTRPFYLGRYEVTLAQWRAVMGTDPAFISDPVPGNQRNSFPVWGVSHVMIAGGDGLNGPQTFLGRTGCRLPTEAEWEYACRAGTRTPFSFGATISPDQANYSTNYVHDEQTTWESLLEGLRALVEPEDPTPMQMTTPVARYPGNPWGLHDMHGNVQEWCADWYDEGLYAACKDGVTDPKGPSIGSTRVVRGGAWYEDAAFLRSAFRDSFPPSFLFFGLGFRVARDP
jgi:formylglycine-generating enzyme required for sulfatase activity